MNSSLSELLHAWRGLSLKKPPYVLKGDDAIPKKWCHRYRNYRDFVRAYELDHVSDKKFCAKLHVGLLPIPYSGNIAEAEIYILGLNPGFDPQSYYAESYDVAFKRESVRQLHQERLDAKFPLCALNPKFCWTGGWRYWETRLNDIIFLLAQQENICRSEALSVLSKKIACLEYVPYYSKNFGLPRSIVNKMLSPKLMWAFVHDYVVPKAQKDLATIIVTRHVDVWNLPKHRNIVAYHGPQSRAAYLNMKSLGGRRIANILGITEPKGF